MMAAVKIRPNNNQSCSCPLPLVGEGWVRVNRFRQPIIPYILTSTP